MTPAPQRRDSSVHKIHGPLRLLVTKDSVDPDKEKPVTVRTSGGSLDALTGAYGLRTSRFLQDGVYIGSLTADEVHAVADLPDVRSIESGNYSRTIDAVKAYVAAGNAPFKFGYAWI
jgi:hypothetical protein